MRSINRVVPRPIDAPQWPIVALVASTGGLEAVSHVLRPLSADLPACVLVLVHGDPTRESVLAEIFSRRCSLPVREAQDDEELCPGEVLVVPPGQHLLVTPALRTALIDSGAYPPHRPSADLLLTSLALSAGGRAVAVVLSGHGHDGATGATAVHRLGGTVLATDEASSAAYSMPSATIARDHTIDHVVDLDAVAPLLAALATAPELPAPGGETPAGQA